MADTYYSNYDGVDHGAVVVEPDPTLFSVVGINAGPENAAHFKRCLDEFVVGREYDVHIRPEPENAFDSSALAVCMNGGRIGYIGKKDQARLLSLLPQVKAVACPVSVASWGVHEETYNYCMIKVPVEP